MSGHGLTASSSGDGKAHAQPVPRSPRCTIRGVSNNQPKGPRRATEKFQRKAATGSEAERRKAFGSEWGSFNSEAAKRLRKKGR